MAAHGLGLTIAILKIGTLTINILIVIVIIGNISSRKFGSFPNLGIPPRGTYNEDDSIVESLFMEAAE